VNQNQQDIKIDSIVLYTKSDYVLNKSYENKHDHLQFHEDRRPRPYWGMVVRIFGEDHYDIRWLHPKDKIWNKAACQYHRKELILLV
jgi:hypothetical protein